MKPYREVGGHVLHGDKKDLVRSKFVNVAKAMHNNPVTGGHFVRDKTLKSGCTHLLEGNETRSR